MTPKKALITLLRKTFTLPVVANQLNATLHQMFEELKTEIYLTTTLKQAQTMMKQAVAHYEDFFQIKFRKLMYYRLTFQIQCISSSQWLNFRMLISR